MDETPDGAVMPPTPHERLGREAPDESPLLSEEEIASFRPHWEEVRKAFVDDPQQAVHMADDLVEQVMRRISAIFASERTMLEGQWSRGEEVTTEQLRRALQQYGAFFERLLSV